MKYWRSIDELEQSPEFLEFMHREFPKAASELPTDISRRRWIQLMGASFALAGVSGCRWEDQKILTYNDRPEGRVPGIPQKYATTYELSGVAVGVLATTYDGRPIKLDINREHPQGYRGTDGFIQASILNLYDPDRVPRVLSSGKLDRMYDPKQQATLRERPASGPVKAKTWADFQEVLTALPEFTKDGSGLSFLVGASSSPTRARLQAELLKKFPKIAWYEYEPISRDNEIQGLKAAFGKAVRPVYKLDQAKVIVSLDANFLDQHGSALKNVRDFANGRVPENGPMNRLYVVESQYTPTGIAADHRLAIPSSKIPLFVKQLVMEVEDQLKGQGHAPKAEAGHEGDVKITEDKLRYVMAKDLVENKGAGIVMVGCQHSVEVQKAIAHLNGLLGNQGKTVQYIEEPAGDRPTHMDALKTLVKEMQGGSVSTLIMIGTNPVYSTPSDVPFADALKHLPLTIHMGEQDDETGLASRWHLPLTHALEAWGDGMTYEGFYALRQPLINPLHYGLSDIQFLALCLGQKDATGQELVRETVKIAQSGALSDRQWKKIVHNGFTPDSLLKPVEVSIAGDVTGAISEWVNKPQVWHEEAYEIVFNASNAAYDGRFANNSWLQETPDNLTKVVWDNVAIISPKTAKDLNVVDNQIIKLNHRNQVLSMPVYVMPGQAYRSIGVALGYGRTAAGHVGGSTIDNVAPVGVNAYLVRTSDAPDFSIVKPEATTSTFKISTTSEHWAIDKTAQEEVARRSVELIREGTMDEFNTHPDFAEHRVHAPELVSLFAPQDYSKGHQWGMSVDLARCTGCSACLVACQAENNVPVVGKDQVSRGREMSWLRLDRYFTGGDIENAPVSVQPVACVHCENAPCEQVCPVAATVHSDDGLNDMVYNRCIGTRYCGNNCPYKVRRFNYLSFIKPMQSPEFQLVQLQLNPEVTVRSRGVMEKCSYCVQRIQNTKIKIKNEQRDLIDGELESACQEACPADAIVFGDINNPEAQVTKNHNNSRAYALLGELNIKPRTKYMARIRNPHPLLKEVYFLQPQAHGHDEHGHGDEHGEKHGDHHDAKDHAHDHDHPHDHAHDTGVGKSDASFGGKKEAHAHEPAAK
jgi:molybdopterin-containing oxidoreductase family iron-sulfur binding subunit